MSPDGLSISFYAAWKGLLQARAPKKDIEQGKIHHNHVTDDDTSKDCKDSQIEVSAISVVPRDGAVAVAQPSPAHGKGCPAAFSGGLLARVRVLFYRVALGPGSRVHRLILQPQIPRILAFHCGARDASVDAAAMTGRKTVAPSAQ